MNILINSVAIIGILTALFGVVASWEERHQAYTSSDIKGVELAWLTRVGFVASTLFFAGSGIYFNFGLQWLYQLRTIASTLLGI